MPYEVTPKFNIHDDSWAIWAKGVFSFQMAKKNMNKKQLFDSSIFWCRQGETGGFRCGP